MSKVFDARISFDPPSEQGFMGQMTIALGDGMLWTPGFFEFHEVFAGAFWLGISVEEAIKQRNTNSILFCQAFHKAFMQSKYPGWPNSHIDKKFRPAAEPAEHTKADVNLGDLDL